jgi:2-hydroxycyclohexanecarboxyl-CoA dehydrogenase
MSLTGKNVIVTGAASGIGLATAQRFAAKGCNVAVWDINEEGAARAAADLAAKGGKAISSRVDVSNRAHVAAALERFHSELGKAQVLVNNAGITDFRSFLDMTEEVWDRVMTINLKSMLVVTQAVLPDMLEAKWGRIVNISSSSAQTGAVHMAHYSSSKGGVIALTKTLALELGPQGITVNTLPPGAVDTPMSRRAAAEGRFGGGTLEDVGRYLPVRRIGVPEDIAAACAYLVSDEAGYVTGQIIGVNGGRVT